MLTFAGSTSPPTTTVAPLALIRSDDGAARTEYLFRRGLLVRLARGVYASAGRFAELPPWERYLARVHAHALGHPGAVFSHESAAVLLGLPVIGEPREVHILHRLHGTSRARNGVRVHTTAEARDIVVVGGIAATSIVETVIDIARSRHAALALSMADAALRLDPSVTVEQLVACNETRRSKRGRRRARWPLHRATALAETPLESVSRAVIEWLGFDDPDLQVVFVLEDTRERVDFLWRAHAICGEADGRFKYDGTHGDPAKVFFDEKTREDRLRRALEGFARWGWDELKAPERLHRILESAGLTPVRTADTAQLHTLRQLLASRTTSAW